MYVSIYLSGQLFFLSFWLILAKSWNERPVQLKQSSLIGQAVRSTIWRHERRPTPGVALSWCISVQKSHSVLSNSLRPHELQQTRFPCPSPTHGSFLKLMSIESLMLSNHLILCWPLLLPPSIFLSLRVFSNESALSIRWPKYWSFSSSISPRNEYSWLICFRMDWFYLLAVQGTLKSLLQQHSSKASIFQWSAFFIVQFSHPYMTTGKTIALIR